MGGDTGRWRSGLAQQRHGQRDAARAGINPAEIRRADRHRLAAGGVAAMMDAPEMMRIASYNIRKAVGLDWKRSGERIVRVLEEIDADVVLLQESDKRIGTRAGVLPVEDLLQRLGYRLVDLSTRPLSHGWHGNAILYRDRSMDLDSSARIKLPSLEPRGAVSALFRGPK